MPLGKTLLILGASGVTVAALFAGSLQLLLGHTAIDVAVALLLAAGVGATFFAQYFAHGSSGRRG